MFKFASGCEKAVSKCYVTHGTMGHLDPKQPPVKRKPFSSILTHPYVHRVVSDAANPEEILSLTDNIDRLTSSFQRSSMRL
jgi:ribonuclease P/MRP protein subunit RPP40